MDGRTCARPIAWLAIALLTALGNAVPAGAAPADVAHGSTRTSPFQGAVAELSRRTPRGFELTQIVVLDGATTTASSTQPPTTGPIRIAHLSVLDCGAKRGRPSGCRTRTSRFYELQPGGFTLDPLLRSAALDVGRGRRRLVVQWHGRGELSTSAGRGARRLFGDPSGGDVWWEVEAEGAGQSSRRASVTIDGAQREQPPKGWLFRGTATYAVTSGCAAEGFAAC